jgi:preprotein translocase subunit SecE
MHVKMTRIESGVTIPKGLFTLYGNVKIVMAKIVWPPSKYEGTNNFLF